MSLRKLQRGKITRHQAEAFKRAWSSPYRHTLKREVILEGVGVHSGEVTRATLRPSHTPAGMMLNQRPLSQWRLASSDWATRLTLMTSIHSASTPDLSTLEHLLAAIYGAGIDDVEIEITRAHSNESDSDQALIEVPILDGSALPYLEQIEPMLTGDVKHKRMFYALPDLTIQEGRCVLVSSGTPLDYTTSPLTMRLTTTLAELYPELLKGDISVTNHDDLHKPLRAQLLNTDHLIEHIAPARTFGLRVHESYLRSQGLIRGVSLENTLIIENNGQTSSSLRHPDELAAHKLLDTLGDLALSGRRWRGHIELRRGSHALNHKLLRSLETGVAHRAPAINDVRD